MSISISGSGGITGATDYSFDNNVSIGGTLTYEDVANIDAVGVVTARQGVVIGTGASVGNPANNQMGLYTNSVERLRINSSGKVGLNVVPAGWDSNAQSSVLQINNSNLFDFNASQFDVGINYYYDGSGYKFTTTGYTSRLTFHKSDGTTRFWTGGTGSADAAVTLTEQFRLTPDGEFLKGTTSSRSNWDNTSGNDPALQVEGSGKASHMSVTNIDDNTSPSTLYLGKTRGSAYQIASNNDSIGEVSFQGADGNEMVAGASIVAQVDGTPGGNDMPGRLVFNTTADGASTPTERVRIDSAGNVLINHTTANMVTPLSVAVTAVATVATNAGQPSTGFLRIHDVGTTDNYFCGIDIRNRNNGDVRILNVDESASNKGAMAFCVDNGSTVVEAMRINSSSRVLIGTNTSTANTDRLIQMGDTSRSATYLEIRNSTTGDGGLLFSDGVDGSSTGYRGTVEYSHNIDAMFFKTSGTTRLWLNAHGVIYSEPTHSNTTSNAANVSCPNSDGQFYRSTSSIKYKDNVTTLTDTLADKILECRPVSYTSKCDGDDKTKINYGLIAEEVNDVDPGLVFLDDGEPEGVQYDRFIPHLINLIKRQKTQIETLETKVAALEGS